MCVLFWSVNVGITSIILCDYYFFATILMVVFVVVFVYR